MGSPADLALKCRAESPVAAGNLFKVAPSSWDKINRAQVLGEYLKALEDERRKIEAFKRELPHCMQLLEYAIDASKGNLVQCPPSCSPGHPLVSIIGKTTKTLGLFGKEMVEEFLKNRLDTIRKDGVDEKDKEKPRMSNGSVAGDRPTWMAEAQLWTQPSLRSDYWKEKESSTEDSVRPKKDAAERSTLTSRALLFGAKQRPGGAFMPFVKEKPTPGPVIRTKPGTTDFMLAAVESRPTATLGFGAVESEVGSLEIRTKTTDVNTGTSQGTETAGRLNGGSNYSGGTGSTTSGGSNAQRKARRCWSPELHRRFVGALQQLGGSQIATPKQIRELMKVDGLTNDEVKSHLQKYRLHTRRPSPTSHGPPQTPPQLVVLGSIWVPPEYGSTGMYHDPSTSVAGQEPILCQPSMSQEFYSQLHPSVQIELHRSPSHSSPQGPLQSTSNLSSGAQQTSGEAYREDSAGEDGKSESSSWMGVDNVRGRSERDHVAKNGNTSSQRDDEGGDGKDGQIQLQLEMSCSRVHSVKAEPLLA